MNFKSGLFPAVKKFSCVAMLMVVCMLGLRLDAQADDPVDDAIWEYDVDPGTGIDSSLLITNEAKTSNDPLHTFDYMTYNINNNRHNGRMYALTAFNGFGYKIAPYKDWCDLADHNLGYVRTSNNQLSVFFGFGAHTGYGPTTYLPNANITIVCLSGGHANVSYTDTKRYAWNTFNAFPLITSGKRLQNGYSRNYKEIQVYCDTDEPNLSQYPNNTPPGYAVGHDFLDYRNHGYILQIIATQCNDELDNDGDGKIDRDDPACRTNFNDPNTYNPSLDCEACNNSQVPGPVINLAASDGTFLDFVRVTWTAAPRATSYELYRSATLPGNGNLGELIASPTTNNYDDTSAVPGVIYYYTAIGVNVHGTGPQSNTDSGFRKAPPEVCPDADGDGSPDADEMANGTDKNDSGSFMLKLNSLPENPVIRPGECIPSDTSAYTKYNVYLSQQNFLELISSGTRSIEGLKTTAFDIIGRPINSVTVNLAAGQELDLDINALIGNRKDTYGVVKINFDSRIAGATLLGRMTQYRPNALLNDYSFAFARELRNSTRGTTFASGNSFDAQGRNFLVPNWAELVNVSDTTQSFVAELYAQDGSLLYSKTIALGKYAEEDIQAGHEYGEVVTLLKVTPMNGNAKYALNISRYSSNHQSGGEALTYNYAFSLEGRAGSGAPQFEPIMNRVGGCYTQTNWVEIINTREKQVTANVTFRNSNGTIAGSTFLPLAARSQYHLNASALLEKGADGSVKIESSDTGALITQSLVYYHDCAGNLLQTAFAAQGRSAGRDVQSGTMNSFLGMQNELLVPGTTSNAVTANLLITPYGSPSLPPQTLSIGVNAQAINQLNSSGAGFPANSYGVVKLSTPGKPQVTAPFILRSRPLSDGRMDFIFPTLIQ